MHYGRGVRNWYLTHAASAWMTAQTSRQIWTTTTSGGTNGLQATAADNDEWTTWLTTRYAAALGHD